MSFKSVTKLIPVKIIGLKGDVRLQKRGSALRNEDSACMDREMLRYFIEEPDEKIVKD